MKNYGVTCKNMWSSFGLAQGHGGNPPPPGLLGNLDGAPEIQVPGPQRCLAYTVVECQMEWYLHKIQNISYAIANSTFLWFCALALHLKISKVAIIQLHILYVFDSIEDAVTTETIMCCRIFVPAQDPSLLEILMIFCIHIPWVILECSAKFRPNCSSFHEITAIFDRKISHFCNFLQICFGNSSETW